MTPRTATIADIDQIAAMHVQCWQETYEGLLPASEIAHRDFAYRRALWAKMIAAQSTMISIIDDVGFAQIGPQRDQALANVYPREIYALYTLAKVHGSGAGQALLDDVMDRSAGGVSVLVLQGNARATAFYRKMGAIYLKQVTDQDGYVDLAFGWRGLTA